MESKNNRAISFRRHILTGMIGWTVIVFALLFLSLYLHLDTHPKELAQLEARVSYRRDLTFRLWATSHGGVYVPIDEKTPPNPYLANIPERDITTPSGRRLTLMNPAYIMRQIHEEYPELYGMHGRLTSLKPLRPENAPDPWEKKALLALAQGNKEVKEYVEVDGVLSLRMMQPLITKKSCLKCHAHQGYKEGDVRGGVSTSLPLSPFVEQKIREAIPEWLSYSILWLLGLVSIWIGTRRLQRRIHERDLAEQQLQEYRDNLQHIVAAKTQELVIAHETLKKNQAQILQQEKMASVGQLAAGVAHEINNPMGFISSNLSSLTKYLERLTEFIRTLEAKLPQDAPDEELADLRKQLKIDYIMEDAVHLVEESLDGAGRVKKIVQGLKNFSRIDQAERLAADINECLDTTLNIVWNELKYKCEVKKEYGELPPTVCNPQQLNQMFMNLLV
ncbi:MAG: DUF3365 domain-containing protein, partial [Desulfurivibrionaceae bacterium]